MSFITYTILGLIVLGVMIFVLAIKLYDEWYDSRPAYISRLANKDRKMQELAGLRRAKYRENQRNGIPNYLKDKNGL